MNRNAWLLIGIIPLFSLFIFFGIWRAIQNRNGDFANYYTASALAAQHRFSDVRFYDHYFFQQSLEKYFSGNLGSFVPFPPATVLPLMPLTLFSPHRAKIIFTFINCVLLALSVYLLSRITDLGFPVVVLLALLDGISLWNQFQTGQLYILLLFSIVLSLYLHGLQKDFWAGAVLGLLLPIKYIPALFVLYFALEKNYKLILGASLSCAVVLCAGLYFTSPEFNYYYYAHILPRHLSGQLQDPYSATFQSYNSLFNGLFAYDPSLNQTPLHNSAVLGVFLKRFVSLAFLTATAFAVHLFPTNEVKTKTLYGAAMLLSFALVNSPASATYHFVLLIVPVVILVSIIARPQYNGILLLSSVTKSVPALQQFAGLVALYAVINLFPFHKLFVFDRHGWLTLVAYIKLLLLTSFFLLAMPRSLFRNRAFLMSIAGIILFAAGVATSQKKSESDNAVWAGIPGLIMKELSVRNDSLFFQRETRTGYIRCANGSVTTLHVEPRRTSHDGKFTLYDSLSGGSSEIVVRNNFAQQSVILTRGNSKNVEPVWAENDTGIYFLSDRGRGIDCTTVYYLPFDKYKLR